MKTLVLHHKPIKCSELSCCIFVEEISNDINIYFPYALCNSEIRFFLKEDAQVMKIIFIKKKEILCEITFWSIFNYQNLINYDVSYKC